MLLVIYPEPTMPKGDRFALLICSIGLSIFCVLKHVAISYYVLLPIPRCCCYVACATMRVDNTREIPTMLSFCFAGCLLFFYSDME